MSFRKCIKDGVGVIVGVNVGWYVGRNVGDSVDREVVGKVGNGDDGGSKLKVELSLLWEWKQCQ